MLRRLWLMILGRAVEKRFTAFFDTPDFREAISEVVTSARAEGAQAERARLDEIMGLPRAAAFPRLAWALASSNDVTMARAIEFLAHAEYDMPIGRPSGVAPSSRPAEDATSAPLATIH